jgi:hypothetical protein
MTKQSIIMHAQVDKEFRPTRGGVVDDVPELDLAILRS